MSTTDVDGVNNASTGFVLVMSALVFIMTPGVGLLYAGMTRSKNALTLIMLSMLSYSVVVVQWFTVGFSLAFSETGSGFIGDLTYGGFANIVGRSLPMTAPLIPASVFAFYQLQFAAVTTAIVFGSVTERCRILPGVVFMVIWNTFVYDVVANWQWSARGWLHNLSCLDTLQDVMPCGMGSLDFAGGGPVHMVAGFSGLAYSLVIGKRNIDNDPMRPHNLTNVFLGTALLWMGWYGFNGGSALAASNRASFACIATMIAASTGSLAWVIKDYLRSGKISGVGYCSGALAGLVGVTPGSGFVSPWAAAIIGIVASVCCNYACRLKEYADADDSLDAFALHGVGGFVGDILCGVFAQQWVARLDGTVILGGPMDKFPTQIGYQLVAAVSISAYAFFATLIIVYVIDIIPGLHLRLTAEEEVIGGDISEMGEIAFEFVPYD